VAVGAPERALVGQYDTVSVCFSKGLGAPIGSALCGKRDFIDQARKVRRRFGGAMRQVGFIAAGALYAVKHHRSRLAEDHRRLSDLALGLKEMGDRYEVSLPQRSTNILYFRPRRETPDELTQRLATEGILMNHLGGGWLRALTHLHISDDDVVRTLAALGASPV
jgi:threonine aldolase